MTIAAEYKVDRTDWDPGPWDDEPDKLNWKTAADLPGMIVRNRSGALCGYVGLPPGHPDHGKGYGDIDDEINVHGGLTYAAACAGAICHVPEPGEPDAVWWLGFDCHHAWDWGPAYSAYRKTRPNGTTLFEQGPDQVYRDIHYVRAEVESLAAQLAARASPPNGTPQDGSNE